MRINGDLTPIHYHEQQAVLLASEVQEFLQVLQQTATQMKQQDFGVSIPELQVRLRVHVFQQYYGLSLALRLLPIEVPELTALNLPPVLLQLCQLQHGLVLIVGPTGSGKSTTLAAMLNYINVTYQKHILTLEDPIEYIYSPQTCLVQQLEIGMQVPNFHQALRQALREDPDYILLGELRDAATMRLALNAAETGHLVFATLHTNTAIDSINRIIDLFIGEEKTLIRLLLAQVLQAVIAQRLVKRLDHTGRVAMNEVLLSTPAIRNLIKEHKISQIYSMMQSGKALGMQTFAQAMEVLIAQKIINANLMEA